MARRNPIKVGLALVLLVTVSSLHQTEADNKCRTGCGGVTPQTFKFQVGTTYQYNYEGNIKVQLSSAQGQQSETKVKATVLLTQLAECNQVLRLQNVQIQGDSKKFGSISDIAKPIKLNYHDGHLEDIICTEGDDTQNSLNIKRAVASMFQAALHHHNTEIDVFGRCPTEFSTHKEGNVFVIKKARNLNKCAFRESISQDFMATAFDLNSEIKTSPFLQGQFSSEIRIKNGIFDQATVTEDYLYVPFSLGSEGAKAKVVSKLSFAKQTKESPKVNCNTPRSIIFEDPHPLLSDKSVSKDLLKLIQETANAMDKTVKDQSANDFYRIIQLMKYAKKDEIVTIYSQVRSGAGFNNQETGKRVFLDALFRVGTGDAIEAAMDIYKNGELNKIEAKLLFIGMTFTKHATKGSLKAATALLSQPNIPREVFLGVGALAGKYCRQHSCENVPELTALLNKLSEKLAKPSNRQNENTVLSALKSITNIGHVNAGTAGRIIDLAQDKQGANRVRASALDAYLAEPCNDKFRTSALSILNDIQQDSEIRIKAYLAAAACPDGKVATAIKTLLDKEESYQVGGFIVSHLATLRSSTNPDKALAKAQLGGIRTTKKFPIDPTKFSRNAEFSHKFDTFGLGGSAESNLIYSAKSYLPRQVSLNLTTEVFGHTFNFLEIDARQENLDKLVEEFVGPMSFARKEDPKDVLSKAFKGAKTLGDKIKARSGRMITKREINKSQIETFGKSITHKENELNKDFDYDLSVKMFGSESLFLSLTEDVKNYDVATIYDKIMEGVMHHVEKAKKFDETVNSNVKFLDTEVSYPTSMGFPLRLTLEGTSSVQMKMSGNLDITKLMSNDFDGEYKLSLIPSANIQIAARFTIDAAVVQRGLKVTGKLFTATGGSIDLILKHDSVDLKYTLPVDKQEIITATHEIVYESREPNGHDTEVSLKQTQMKDLTVCLDQLKPFVGVVFCAHLNQPNIAEAHGTVLPYPLNGNSKFSITVDKGDLGHIRFTSKSYNSDKIGIEVLTEAISNQNKPKASLKMELFARPDLYFTTVFNSEIKKASFEARIVNKDTELSGFVKANYDPFEYYAKVGVSISGNQQRSIYKPVMEFKAGQGNVQNLPYRVEGQIIVDTQGAATKYTFDKVKIVGIPNPLSVSGNLGREPGAVSADVQVTDGKQSGSLNGKIQYGAEKLTVNAIVKNSINPQLNFNVKYDITKKANELESSLSFQHGNLASKDNIFKLKNAFKWQQGDRKNDFETENHMSYAALGIDNKFDLEVKEKSVKYDVEFAYRKVKLGSELDAKVNRKVLGDYDVEFEAHGFDNKIEIDMRRDVDRYKSKIKNVVTVNGKTLDVSGDVTHHVDTNRMDIGTDLTVKMTGHPDLKVKTELKQTPQELDTSIKVMSGSKILIDSFLKANKAGSANGNLKVTIDGIVTAQGQVKSANFKGNADLLVHIVKFDRKIKSETAFNVKEPTFNYDITLYTNFQKDNARKYRLTTNNQIKAESFNTENTLEILGKKTTANIKGGHSGDIKNGKQNGEFDVTLPNDMYFTGKFEREHATVKGVDNGFFFINLEQRDNKNAQGRKFTLKGTGKNIDVEAGSFDVTYNLVLDDSNGKNLNGDLTIKGGPQGAKKHIDYNAKLYGSVIPEQLETTFTTTYGPMNGDYSITTKYGKDSSAALKGKYDLHRIEDRKTSTGDISLEIHTPSPRVKVIKINADSGILIPTSKDDQFEYTDNLSVFIAGADPTPIADFENKLTMKLSQHKGVLKASHTSKKHDPISFDMDYEVDPGKKYHGDFEVGYAKGKHVKSEATVTIPALHQYVLDFKLQTPDERVKTIEITSNGKIVPEAKTFTGESNVILNGQKYNLKETLGFSEHTPNFLFELTSPDGKLDKIGASVNSIGHRSISATTTILIHRIDFAFDGSLDVDAEKIEDFDLKLQLNSPKLKMDKLIVTANTKETKGTNKLNVSAKMANQNIVSGTATYKTREEGSKFLLEGSGSFTIKNDKRSGNIKYTRNNLDATRDKEQGVEFLLQGSIGDKALDSEVKFTDKHFRYLVSYCEQKKDCANIELDAKTTGDFDKHRNVIEANIDLRKLGFSHEFGLKSETKRDKLILDHTTDIHFQNKQSKYQYNMNLHPTTAGISITTPKRIVSLESTVTRPEIGKVGPVKGEVAFYMNKKERPNEKTSLTYAVVPKDEKTPSFDVEVKFTHPALRRPLSVTYKGIADNTALTYKFQGVLELIPNSDKKITFSGQSDIDRTDKSLGYKGNFDLDVQPIKYKFNGNGEYLIDFGNKKSVQKLVLISYWDGYKVESSFEEILSPNKASSKLVVHNNVMWDASTNMQLSKESQVFDTNVKVIGLEPLSSHLEIKNFNTIKFNLAKAATKDPKLEINSAFVPGQMADFRMDFYKGGKKIDLVHGSVKLDETDFMKSDYGIKTNEIKEHLIGTAKQMTSTVTKETSNAIKKSGEDMKVQWDKMVQNVKQNQPDLKGVSQYYEKELKSIQDEIAADPNLKAFSEAATNVVKAVITFVTEMSQTVGDTITKMLEIFNSYQQNMAEVFQKDILPKLKEAFEKVADQFLQTFEKLSDVYFKILGEISAFIDAHQAELKQIATTLTTIGKDTSKFLITMYGDAKNIITTEYNKLYEEIKALPYFEKLQAILKQIKEGVPVPEHIISQFQGFVSEVSSKIPIPALQNLVDLTAKYIVKKMKLEKVDDLAEIQAIIKAATEAITIIIRQLQASDFGDLGKHGDKFQVPLSGKLMYTIPKLIAGQLSFVNRIINGDIPTIEELTHDFTLNPLSWIPPFRRYAVVAQGQHIFTFDGKHLTFPGKCNYMLARDLNGQFSIVGTYADGILTELSFYDKTDVITIKKAGVATLNGAASELPVRGKLTSAFRLYTQVDIKSDTGVQIFCAPDLSVCVFSVSGFYHGRLRGLLGNANFEAFDDYTLPNGKIVTAESEFGNSYKMQTSCPTVQTVDHHTHHRNEECTKIFGDISTLSPCFPVVKTDIFRQACDHGMAGKVPDTLKSIASAYAATCATRGVPVPLPKQFVTCTNGDKEYQLWDTFSVKTPQKAADIVFAIDVDTSNQKIYTDLITQLGPQLTKDLAERGVKDVEFHIIAYGGDQPIYPSHVTSNQGKMTFKGKFPTLKFSDPEDDDDIQTDIKQLDFVLSLLANAIHDFNLAIGNNPQSLAYVEGIKYPFRAHAAKTIIAVTTGPCESGALVLAQKLRAIALHDRSVMLNVFTSMNGANFKVKDDKTTKNTIGFNRDGVFTFAEAKKKPTGNPSLVSELSYNDFCSEFTARGGGNIFVTDNFKDANKNNKKLYVQVASYNIAESLAGTEQGLDCICTRDGLYTASNRCRVVNSTKKAPSNKKIMRG